MQRMKWWILWFLVSVVLSLNCVSGQAPCVNECQINNVTQCANCCMTCIDAIFKNGSHDEIIKAMKSLEDVPEDEEMNGTEALQFGNFTAYLFKPNGTFEGLSVNAGDQETSESALPNSTVRVQLPGGLKAGQNNTIALCMFMWPETNPESKKPSCQFFNFSTNNFRPDSFTIERTPGQKNVTRYPIPIAEEPPPALSFASLVLPIYSHRSPAGSLAGSPAGSPKNSPNGSSPGSSDISSDGSPDSLSSTDHKILMYITLIGCSLSLFALVITILLFITNRKLREDVSMKVHINLVIALILLNLHFLLSQIVAPGSSTGLCLYMALVLHYALLATFSWMALEGFNLYLLVVKVFDIYVSRYLLKLSVVGWGVPAVIVSVVVIINRGFYGQVSGSNGTAICYITNKTVKLVTTAGLFFMVFFFNVIVFVVTVKRVFSVGHRSEIDCNRVGQHIFRLLGVGALLGITWGLVFFSFGHLTTPGIYLFSILNSLQGFFIFLWFVMSLRKAKNSAPKTSSDTCSTSI